MRADLHGAEQRTKIVAEAQLEPEPLTGGVQFGNGMEFEEPCHTYLRPLIPNAGRPSLGRCEPAAQAKG